MASHVDLAIKEDDLFSPLPEIPGEDADPRVALVRRVLGSSTFERCPTLRAFLRYVCRCAVHNEPAAATEPQIGIHVFGRAPGYNTNDDNIVRSQARLLRLKLEHHFTNEALLEPVIIVIPKGRYLPAFEPRVEHASLLKPSVVVEQEKAVVEPSVIPPVAEDKAPESKVPRNESLRWAPWALTALLVLAVLGFARDYVRSGRSASDRERASDAPAVAPAAETTVIPPVGTEIRIAVGNTGAPYTDADGRQWASDEFYQGGASEPDPQILSPPVSDPGLFSKLREGVPLSAHVSSGFRYDIPVPRGVYELKLYFADPLQHAVPGHDGQHMRHFQVNVNGNPILTEFDAVADAGFGSVDIRTFKDIAPADDGKVHVEFVPSSDPPILSALELTPGVPGKLLPIRFTAHTKELVDSDGTRWGGDQYFIHGNTLSYSSPESPATVPPVYSVERFGNFSYAIPVPPGTYTVRLHFMETFFGPSVPSGECFGAGCRVFDVTCNGETLLKDFDIFQAAGGDYRPLVRTFKGLHPNGQGKLLLSFSPSADYGEVRAIEVIDEGAPKKTGH